jgi:hypothetical protein
MASLTPVYYYNQRQTVVLVESGTAIATRRYETVYSKELTISKGVDNIIEFAFINQDQKKVDITGRDVTFRILSNDGTSQLLQKTLTPIYAATGLTSILISAADIELIEAQRCSYTLEIPVDSYNRPVFVDEYGGTRGVLNIIPGTQPSFVESTSVTVPSHSWLIGAGANVTYYSSVIDTKERDRFTIQTNYSNFTGYTTLEGSTVQDFTTSYNIISRAAFNGYSATVANITVGSNTWITQSITDTANVFVGANVVTTAMPTNRHVVALGTGSGNIELNDSSNLAIGDTITWSTVGYTGTTGETVMGYHPYVRLKIENYGTPNVQPSANANATTTYYGGDVTKILFR